MANRSYRFVAFFGSLERANGLVTQLSYFLLYVCVATQLNQSRSIRLLTAIILTAIPICFLGLAQAFGWQPLPVFSDGRSLLTTTLGRSNFTGAYIAMLLPLTFVSAWLYRGHWKSKLFLVLYLIELLVIGLTLARGAWIASFMGMGVLLCLHKAPRWSFRSQIAIAIGAIAGITGLLTVILQIGINEAGSIAARWTIWKTSLDLLWPQLWLGYGADTFEFHFHAVYPPQLVYYQGRGVVVDRAHNFLLDCVV